jgi:hypothetical protein
LRSAADELEAVRMPDVMEFFIFGFYAGKRHMD